MKLFIYTELCVIFSLIPWNDNKERKHEELIRLAAIFATLSTVLFSIVITVRSKIIEPHLRQIEREKVANSEYVFYSYAKSPRKNKL